jgi:hypothetical protein
VNLEPGQALGPAPLSRGKRDRGPGSGRLMPGGSAAGEEQGLHRLAMRALLSGSRATSSIVDWVSRRPRRAGSCWLSGGMALSASGRAAIAPGASAVFSAATRNLSRCFGAAGWRAPGRSALQARPRHVPS